RWGILFREFLEIWDDGNYEGKWNRRIDGVEIFQGYIKDYHKYFYSNIYIDNALSFVKSMDRSYDLINFGDVVEHLEKKEGEELIHLALEKSKCVLINIPIGKYWKQVGTKDNPYEAHKSIWHNNDFTKYKYHIIKSFDDIIYRDYSVVLLSKNKIEFTKKYGKHFKLKNFLKHKLHLKKIIESFGK
ncbi:MAG: hypothetical protein ABIO44_12010, partial [Saprospiraceae bacterium]